MKKIDISYEMRVSLLMLVTSFVMLCARIPLQGWGKDGLGWEFWLGGWFVHYMALWFLYFFVVMGIQAGSLRIFGERINADFNDLKLRYHFTVTVLVTTLAILFIVKVVPKLNLGSDLDY